MARVLVLGGTRFVGRRTAIQLAEAGHEVTVLSRRAAEVPGTRRIVAERAAGLASLAGERFDLVLDFIAYDESGFSDACAVGETYLGISSAWLPRLSCVAADAPVPPDDSHAPLTMLALTRRYLLGKARLEDAVRERRMAGGKAAVVRLPILMGDGDHTGRLEFYRARIADGGGVLMVDGGVNEAQILWSEDAARALTALVGSGIAGSRWIWEALPDAGHPVRDLVATVAHFMNTQARLFEVPAQSAASIKGYLEAEPLWRESALRRTASNVFTGLGLQPTPAGQWLARVPDAGTVPDPDMRKAEIALVGSLA
jgi:nucleoside-diphosphate-sugar epimerase